MRESLLPDATVVCLAVLLLLPAFGCRDADETIGAFSSRSSSVTQNIAFARILQGRLFDIFIVSENGVGLLNLTDHAANDLDPRWSPDGSSIAFESTREGPPNIFVMPATGSAARNVTRFERSAREASWFPDARRIAFEGETVEAYDIYVTDIVDSTLVNLTQGRGANHYPQCSPDGSMIAFVSDRDGRWGLYVMGSDGSALRRLSDVTGFDETFTLKWSPDSRFLLVNLNTGSARDLFSVRIDGTGVTNLTNHPADDVGGDWSPDGRYIVFQSNRSGKDAIYRMEATGVNVAKISAGEGDRFPTFSPNGLWVMFLSLRRGAYEIWLVDPGGAEEFVVAPTEISDLTPRWRPVTPK